MRFVFYNTCSNYFDPAIVHIRAMPSWAEEWGKVKALFPEHEFILAAMLPAMFLFDYDGEKIFSPDDGIRRVVLNGGGAKKIAQEIMALKPDVAVAASFWITPCDWLGLQDAMVADILRRNGIAAVCHSAKTQSVCFDKRLTHIFLRENNFNCARAVFVDYDLFWRERKNGELRDNVYREFILNEIASLRFPIVIKDATGVSSYGMEVIKTMGAARAYLESKKFNSDRLAEEFLDGPQFGTEIHSSRLGADGGLRVDVFPPLLYSVNQYGICSPKQSVKLGPLADERFKCAELKAELERLARALDFEGIAQVDLVFHNGAWNIIEINPRLSGSSAAIALIKGKTLPRILTDFALGAAEQKRALAQTENSEAAENGGKTENAAPLGFAKNSSSTKNAAPLGLAKNSGSTESAAPLGLAKNSSSTKSAAPQNLWTKNPPLYLNIKFPNLTKAQMEALYALPFVRYLCQTDNDAAKQRREMGFCEILLGGSPDPRGLEANLDEIKEKFPEIIEPGFFETAKKMLALLS